LKLSCAKGATLDGRTQESVRGNSEVLLSERLFDHSARSGGWPSLTGVNVKPFLGQGHTQERVFMRVCDWWRRENDLLVENWVFVDIPHFCCSWDVIRYHIGKLRRLSTQNVAVDCLTKVFVVLG
jgi:hypothetical protein